MFHDDTGRASTAANTAAYLTQAPDRDRCAWIDGHREYSHAELRTAAAAIARRLRAQSLPGRSPVALVAGNGVFWIAAYLAIFAEGHIAVPMSTTLSAHEATERAQWAGCRAVACGDGFAAVGAAAREHELAVIDEALLPEGWAGESGVLSPVPVNMNDDAAYLFTSGTTSTPRAVRITHANIRANTDSILAYLGLCETDRTLVVLPFSYVFGASLLHTHLRAGASLAHHTTVAYPQTTVARLAELACTGIAGVPSVYNALVRNSAFASTPLPALRIMQQAGGSLSPAVADELAESHPDARLFIMYGQTEATARLSYLPPEDRAARRGSVGRGIPGVTLQVVDEDGRQVAPGTIGEIRARGRNISPGYLNDPQASARKMGGGILRTGDLATVDADGYIYVVDRVEDFIKSWGHRVSSTDVEAAAMTMHDLVAVAAVGVPDDAAGERIELVVVRRDDSTADAADVLAHCRTALPRHMVPAQVRFVDALPLNSSGKVLKRAVRELCARETVS